jgi:hypothetical protein
MGELRKALAVRVSDKKFARERLGADIRSVAAVMSEQTGHGYPGDVRTTARGELLDACADAAGVPVMVEAIETASLLRARRATGWPLTSWMTRFRHDPMKRLGLPEAGESSDPISAYDLREMRVKMPAANDVQRARVDSAVRAVADTVTEGMAHPWEDAVREASVAKIDGVTDALGEAVAHTDLGVSRNPWWWGGVRVLQWLLLLAAVGGGLWFAALAMSGSIGDSSVPELGGIDLPVLLLIAGIAAGLVIAVGCRFAARISARRRARRAELRLHMAVEQVTDELVVEPVQAEVDAYVKTRDGLEAALKR